MSTVRVPVEEGMILLFARAIGDPNPVYTDAESAAAIEFGGLIAPPTYIQVAAQFDPDYEYRPRLSQPWMGSGRNPTGRPESLSEGTLLHAEQHFEYHRPLRPGDVLTASRIGGSTWSKEGRSGMLFFSESITDYRTQDGELAVRSRMVVVTPESTRKAG